MTLTLIIRIVKQARESLEGFAVREQLVAPLSQQFHELPQREHQWQCEQQQRQQHERRRAQILD